VVGHWRGTPPDGLVEAPDLGNCRLLDWPRGTGGPIPTEMNPEVTLAVVSDARPLKTLLFAIVAPFAAIGLLATPLVFDAAKHALGI
jgi:hypothetical protein